MPNPFRNTSIEDLLKNNPALKVKGENNIEQLAKRQVTKTAEKTREPPMLPCMNEGLKVTKATLPFPPSVNMAFPTNKFGKRYKSPRYNAFQKKVYSKLANIKYETFKGELRVFLWLYRPKKQGDIDNYNKCIFDTLKNHFFLDDDQIVELFIYRRDDKNNPRIEIEIYEL